MMAVQQDTTSGGIRSPGGGSFTWKEAGFVMMRPVVRPDGSDLEL